MIKKNNRLKFLFLHISFDDDLLILLLYSYLKINIDLSYDRMYLNNVILYYMDFIKKLIKIDIKRLKNDFDFSCC